MDEHPRGKLYQEIASRIKAYILDSGLRPGDRLPTEAELAARFRVSRSSVREAIKSLEMIGVLVVQPRTGCRLRPFDHGVLSDHVRFQYQADVLSLRELLEARELVEMAVLELAIQRADEEHLQALDKSLLVMESCDSQSEAWPDADMRFHEALFKATDNRLLESFIDVMREFFAHLAKSGIARDWDPAEVLDEHRMLRNAIKSRDLVVARQLLREHLQHYYKDMGISV